MFIGQHYLEGSLVNLKNPLILVEKRQATVTVETAFLETNSSNKAGDGACEDLFSDLVIEGYVRNKIIFKTRPKPVGLLRVLK